MSMPHGLAYIVHRFYVVAVSGAADTHGRDAAVKKPEPSHS